MFLSLGRDDHRVAQMPDHLIVKSNSLDGRLDMLHRLDADILNSFAEHNRFVCGLVGILAEGSKLKSEHNEGRVDEMRILWSCFRHRPHEIGHTDECAREGADQGQRCL